jgi:hypothetical protein
LLYMNKVPYDIEKFKSSLMKKFINTHLFSCLFLLLIFVPFKRFLPILLSLLLTVLSVAIIAINLHLKDRVSFPMIFCICLLSIFIFINTKKNEDIRKFTILPKNLQTLLPFGALLVLLIFALNTFRNQIIKHYNLTVKNKVLLNNQLKELNNPNQTYAIFGCWVNFEAESPFATHFHKTGLPKVYPISAFNRSPLYSDEFKLLGNGEFTQILLNEKVSLVTKNGNVSGSSPENMQLFYAEHLKCNAIIRSNNVYEDADIRIYSLGPCVSVPDPLINQSEKHQ